MIVGFFDKDILLQGLKDIKYVGFENGFLFVLVFSFVLKELDVFDI